VQGFKRQTLGLEHTRVEAFPGEMTDNARFMDVLGNLEKDPDLAEVGIQTSASIEVAVSIRNLMEDFERRPCRVL